MALFNVTNLFDSGLGSLRQAILDSNSTAEADEIQFSSISGTITLTSGSLNITDSLTINGIGADLLTVSGNNASRVFSIGRGKYSFIDVYLNGLRISDGYSNFKGGGIFNTGNLTITNSTIFDNTASSGGGVYSESGTTSISNSTISDNTAQGNGGGVYSESGTTSISNSTISDNTAQGNGGGVSNLFGTTSISNSTISDNTASSGGGVFNLGSTTNISNSTISDNTASNGGGVFNVAGTMNIGNSTISGNTAKNGNSGGIFSFGSNRFDLTNTIIANSTGRDCTLYSSIGLSTNINNLIEDGSCNPLLSGDPNLGPLQDNGGPTFTQALLPDSIAIDAGSNAAIPPGITTDQRGPGFPRIINGTVDIGAYEAGQNGPRVPESSSLFGVLILGLVAVVSLRRRRK